MRRLAAIGIVLALAAATAVVLGAGAAQGSSTYRIDAIFDDAKGMVPGQLVEIADARVGKVAGVTLTPDFKARIELQVDGRFAPFHANATCEIEPQGLIAENFINCNPGSSAAPALSASGGYPPTVPVTQDAEPVSITDLFNVWNTPTADRVTVLLNELGAGVAGQGQNLNAILQRSNPALTLARRAITLLNHQRAQLEQIVSSTDPVVAQLAQHGKSVQRFLSSAASVARTSAAHSTPLAQSINRLPGLLAAAQPALQQLDVVAANGSPVLSDLHSAAPQLNRAVNDIGPFSAAALPALHALGPSLARTTTDLRNGAPNIAALRSYAHASNPTSQGLDELLTSARNAGFVENTMTFAYDAQALLGRYDSVGHIAISNVIVNPNCIMYATAPTVGCSAWFPNDAQRFETVHRSAPRAHAAPPQHTAGAPVAQVPTLLTHVLPPISHKPGIIGGVQQLLGGVVSQLQNTVGTLLAPALPAPNDPNPTQGTLKQVLSYLLH